MWRRACAFALIFLLGTARPASAYSVLTHEAIIDTTWNDAIVPLLRARFRPTAQQLQKARAYAYGGSVLQDMGYYPFSSRLFGDMVHYVRSGDFVESLIQQSTNLDEYAFALGALAHFAADNNGHPQAVNRAVPLLYPKLEAKFGHPITYEESPSAHLATEFAFDVLQVARGAYASKAYHDFIGFEISRPVLERALLATYGLEVSDVFGNFDFAVSTLRHAVGTLIPQMTKVAWTSKRDEIVKLAPKTSQQQFQFSLSKQDYEREWGSNYGKPNIGHQILAVLFKIVPKIGPLKPLAFTSANKEAEQLFLRSFDRTVAEYRALLQAAGRNRLALANLNFDTGDPVTPGTYRMVDEVYAQLLEKLASRKFAGVPPALRADILKFYASPDASNAVKQDRKAWQAVGRNVQTLRATSPIAAPARDSRVPRDARGSTPPRTPRLPASAR